jgi:hypothetical protein
MIPQKITTSSIIAAIAIASIALVVGLSQTQTTTAADAPTGNNVYVFAEGVNPQVTFKFKEATVTYDFQAYTQTNSLFDTRSGGVSRSTAPEFVLERIAGDTPYLHRAVDQTWENAGRITGLEYPYRLFDVNVDFIQAGQPVRSFEYGDCSVTNYKVRTEYDKEEGYTTGGKTGFAVIETYTFICNGFNPVATMYDTMKANNDDKYTPYIAKN